MADQLLSKVSRFVHILSPLVGGITNAEQVCVLLNINSASSWFSAHLSSVPAKVAARVRSALLALALYLFLLHMVHWRNIPRLRSEFL
jgi:hypothetical protein